MAKLVLSINRNKARTSFLPERYIQRFIFEAELFPISYEETEVTTKKSSALFEIYLVNLLSNTGRDQKRYSPKNRSIFRDCH